MVAVATMGGCLENATLYRRRPAGNRYGIAIFLAHAKRLREFRTLHAGCVIPVKLPAEEPISKQRLVVSPAGGERAQDVSIAAARLRIARR